jgi:BASS family bile acid:Na+ symporter
MDSGISIQSIIDGLIQLNTVLLMLTMGLSMTFKQAFVLWQKPKKLLISLLAAVVLVVVATVVILQGVSVIGLAIPAEVQIALLLMAGASGNALAPGLAVKVGSSKSDAISLMVSLGLASIVAQPIIVGLFMPADVAVSVGDVAMVVIQNMLIPLFIGLAIRTWWVTAADYITDPLTKVSGFLLQAVVIIIIVKDFRSIVGLGLWVALFILFMLVVWLGIGHLLGGPELKDRLLLGANSSQRNGAVAMLVALQGMQDSIPALVAIGVLALIVVVTYFSTVGKKLAPAEGAEATAAEGSPSAAG